MDIANCISHEPPPQTVLMCTLKREGKEGVGEGARKRRREDTEEKRGEETIKEYRRPKEAD